ncbi:hypothetical protein DFH09DRAFT_953061 [Mycena vulgaris]|nr:hypothetical protein DFH09DRAFT_953061 [Mycena vulgaris]
MSTKLEFPILRLADELSPASINGWLGRCEDMYEAWLATQSTEKVIEPRTLITLAGLRMEEPTAATWWNENREELKKLASWELFAQKIRGRFVPANWRMEALSTFYNVEQGALTFPEFAKQLQRARNSLASAGTGYTINNSIFKNHLLFRAQPILRLRVIGQQGFAYADMKFNSLITTMSSIWASLIAERVVKVSPVPPHIHSIRRYTVDGFIHPSAHTPFVCDAVWSRSPDLCRGRGSVRCEQVLPLPQDPAVAWLGEAPQ